MTGILFPPKVPSEEDLLMNFRELAQRVIELEVRLGERDRALHSREFSDDKLATIAASAYRMRNHRKKHFEPSLFGEPAWDMLLDLFINKVRGARISTTSLCLAASVPQATGIRWIRLLEKHGLLQRFRPLDDARLTLTEITATGYKRMRLCLTDAVTRYKLPIPD